MARLAARCRLRARRTGWPNGIRARRGLYVLAGAALAVAGLAVLRTSAVHMRPGPSADRSAHLWDSVRGLHSPPFDGLPGRTRIPTPEQVESSGQAVRGALPPVGGPGPAAATRSADLVMGRYCWEPARYAVTVTSDQHWTRATARAFRLDRGGNGADVLLDLVWTGRSYTWAGSLTQLSIC